jgi:hypothetical protein
MAPIVRTAVPVCPFGFLLDTKIQLALRSALQLHVVHTGSAVAVG